MGSTGVLSARKLIGLLMAISLIVAGCGGTDDGADDTAAGAGNAAEDETAADQSNTSEATTTTEAPTTTESTTTTAPTTTEDTLAEADFDQHLADALLTADDLPPYLYAEVENTMAMGPSSISLGDLVLTPCGEELAEEVAIDARQSIFLFDQTAEVEPVAILLSASSIVRQVFDEEGPSLVDQFSEALGLCTYEEVTLPTTGETALIGPVVEVADRAGVRAAGSQALIVENGLTVFDFVFETDDLDAHLIVTAYGAETPEEAQALALGVVETFQDRIGACAADTEICAADL